MGAYTAVAPSPSYKENLPRIPLIIGALPNTHTPDQYSEMSVHTSLTESRWSRDLSMMVSSSVKDLLTVYCSVKRACVEDGRPLDGIA